MKPDPRERLTTYVTRLREKTKHRELDNAAEQILEHVYQTLPESNANIVKKSAFKQWNMTQFLTEVAEKENINAQMKTWPESTEEANIAKIHAGPGGRKFEQKYKATRTRM